MKIITILLSALLGCMIEAKEIANEALGYSVTFPENRLFTGPEHTQPAEEIDLWKSESTELGQELTLMVIDALMPGGKANFEENAREWEAGMLKSFTKKVSSGFTSLGGEPALQVITTLDVQGIELYFSNWYIQKGQTTYNLTVASIERGGLNNEHSKAFLHSFKLNK